MTAIEEMGARAKKAAKTLRITDPETRLFLPGLNRIHDFLFVVSSKDYSTEYTEDPADALRKVQEAQAIPSCVQTMQTRRSFLHF